MRMSDITFDDMDLGNGLVPSRRQHAITSANCDTDLCCHVASLGHSGLINP